MQHAQKGLAATDSKKDKHIVIKDSFAKWHGSNSFNEIVAIKNDINKQLQQNLKEIIKKDFNLMLNHNICIPMDKFDNFLHLLDVDKTGISFITGFDGSCEDTTMEEYLPQFIELIKHKKYISGIYCSFVRNKAIDFHTQKNLILELLDFAQESKKTVYMGLTDAHINLWKDIFDEFDLSELNFVYTDAIKNKEELNFITENNIKLLLTDNIELENYIELIEKYNLLCIGSNILEKNTYRLSNLATNLHNYNESLFKGLLNLE